MPTLATTGYSLLHDPPKKKATPALSKGEKFGQRIGSAQLGRGWHFDGTGVLALPTSTTSPRRFSMSYWGKLCICSSHLQAARSKRSK
ncbi:MAG TPA: hypothetical protein VMM15_32140 [Bradyrhizobium sp.]|nr:hypothetical protein [Bradyrhizobium sp.]